MGLWEILLRNSSTLPQWAPKVSRTLIRRLYLADASGITDDDLVNEVGWALWSRCDSILKVTAAHNGTVECPSCSGSIDRELDWEPEAEVHCDDCGWTLSWREYHATYKGKQLFAANAETAFHEFHERFPRAKSPSRRMVMIDQLIHAFHISVTDVGRPAASNLISGSLGEVIRFLDQLSSGPDSASGITDGRSEWRATLERASWASEFLDQCEDDANSNVDAT